jgi:hypothetical protein
MAFFQTLSESFIFFCKAGKQAIAHFGIGDVEDCAEALDGIILKSAQGLMLKLCGEGEPDPVNGVGRDLTCEGDGITDFARFGSRKLAQKLSRFGDG